MTLNEVEQAIRNLITNQPMVTSGPTGDVVNNMLSIINSYRNFRFLVQNHPAQDTFKFNAMNISQRTESDLANAMCQTLQERGINLMMYMSQPQFGMQGYPYQGVQPQGMAPNGMNMGSALYNNQMPQSGFGNPNVQFNNTPMGAYPQSQFRPNNAPRPVMANSGRFGNQLYPRTAAPTQPIMFDEPEENIKKPTKPHKKSGFSIPKPVAQPTKAGAQTSKAANEPKVQRNTEPRKLKPDPQKKIEEPVVEHTPEPEIINEPQVNAPTPAKEEKPDMVKATGRNYLLELLKK